MPICIGEANEQAGKGAVYRTRSKSSRAYFVAIYSMWHLSQAYAYAELSVDMLYLWAFCQQPVKWLGGGEGVAVMAPLAPPGSYAHPK